VQRAPGIPHALNGRKVFAKARAHRAARRDIAFVIGTVIAREQRDEAIHSYFFPGYGLLRFARNDGSTTDCLWLFEN
jgi:hypothetical protein